MTPEAEQVGGVGAVAKGFDREIAHQVMGVCWFLLFRVLDNP